MAHEKLEQAIRKISSELSGIDDPDQAHALLRTKRKLILN